ncbi:NAD(P)H-binding protein [Bradyrhizobium sp. WYCCWR 13023]|uniref:NAD(P)H-binding protein n=1 Tax=Bradyrhizobium zhengyangense TaxID=2911009 RepID=A0A9X1R8P1_9BRAD|nr:NAD(P)H-binding protein [Bradyrhizobium zhengyangense]MCG2626274.1 NAD(P)H-binding protein [Bradyrhizobium zhengyangense]MCG2644714.1 NAD(P)H-binding protein [Bradyrhizobium zhengyangense]
MDHSKPILVTGAAGQIGSVGRHATELLLARGYRVRAQVRTDDRRAAALRALGAEVVVGDLLDLKAAHQAVEGCDRLYFGMSLSPQYLEASVNVAAVAKHHKVKAFVNMSQMTVKEMSVCETTSSPQQKQHWLAEQVLSWSGLPVVEVRPTAFMEGLFLQLAGAVAAQDKILAPLGGGNNSAIAAFDVARVVAEILGAPDKHIGQTYHLTGPVSQDVDAIAREFSLALGRPISYVNVPPDIWAGKVATLGLPSHVVSHITTMTELHRDNRYDRYSDDVEKITGQRPMSVREFVEKNAATFTPSS